MEAIENKELFSLQITQQDLDAFGEVRNTTDPDIFIPNKHNAPDIRKPIGFLNDVPCMKVENTIAIVGHQGKGKSTICEAICAKILNPDCDGLGFHFSDDVKKVILFDFERRDDDLYLAWERTLKTAEMTMESEELSRVTFVGMYLVESLERRMEKIRYYISSLRPDLVIIDGITDLVESINTEEETNNVKYWLRKRAKEFKLTFIVTIHPNLGTDKPRGWIGSSLVREGESVFYIQREGNIHTITTNWVHGKNRNGGTAESRFRYSTEQNCFISVDAKQGSKESISILTRDELNDLFETLILQSPGMMVNAEKLRERLHSYLKSCPHKIGTSNQAISKHIEKLMELGHLEKRQKGKSVFYYRCLVENEF